MLMSLEKCFDRHIDLLRRINNGKIFLKKLGKF